MQNLISAEVNAHGTKLHYYRTGGDKQPLVLVHGITDDGLCWTPVAEKLAVNYDVIMVDARGHGKSDAPEDGYTLRIMASELARLIRILELKDPILLGHSMGAVTSLVLAGLFPEIPKAILLEDPPAFWCFDESDHGNNEFRNSLLSWIIGNKRKTRDDLLVEGQSNPNWSQAELAPWIDAKHRYSLKITDLLFPEDIISIDFPKILRKITCPTFLISADTSLGAVSNKEQISVLKRFVPQLQEVHIEGAGHNIRRDQFENYISTVDKFLLTLK